MEFEKLYLFNPFTIQNADSKQKVLIASKVSFGGPCHIRHKQEINILMGAYLLLVEDM